MLQHSLKADPRILLLSGGIEFQRTDTRLSSLETLIEQEDRYLEILVDKIMTLRPGASTVLLNDNDDSKLN